MSKYNSTEDVGGKFEMMDADKYWTTDRELNTVWDELPFGSFETIEAIDDFLASKGIHKNPDYKSEDLEKDAKELKLMKEELDATTK